MLRGGEGGGARLVLPWLSWCVLSCLEWMNMIIPYKGIIMFIQARQDKTHQAVFEVVLRMWMERERHFEAWRPRTPSPPPPFVVGVTCTFPLLETVARWCAEREPHRLTLIPRNHVYICVIPSFCSCFVILCLLASCSPPLLSFGLFIVSCLLWSRCYQRIQETIKGENKRQEDK